MKILLAKKLSGLVPIDDEGRDALKGFKHGEILRAEITKPRDGKRLRQFFVMLEIILNNQEYYQNITDLRAVCLCEIGHCHTIVGKDGKVYSTPKSISFANMDQLEFNALYDKAVRWVCTTVVPGLDAQGLNEEVQRKLLDF